MNLRDVKTRNDFAKWIEENIPADKYTDGNPLKAADWFLAIYEAKVIFDSYRTKDLASVLLDGGFEVIAGNDEYHKNFFANLRESVEDGYDDAFDDLEDMINNHFGL